MCRLAVREVIRGHRIVLANLVSPVVRFVQARRFSNARVAKIRLILPTHPTFSVITSTSETQFVLLSVLWVNTEEQDTPTSAKCVLLSAEDVSKLQPIAHKSTNAHSTTIFTDPPTVAFCPAPAPTTPTSQLKCANNAQGDAVRANLGICSTARVAKPIQSPTSATSRRYLRIGVLPPVWMDSIPFSLIIPADFATRLAYCV